MRWLLLATVVVVAALVAWVLWPDSGSSTGEIARRQSVTESAAEEELPEPLPSEPTIATPSRGVHRSAPGKPVAGKWPSPPGVTREKPLEVQQEKVYHDPPAEDPEQLAICMRWYERDKKEKRFGSSSRSLSCLQNYVAEHPNDYRGHMRLGAALALAVKRYDAYREYDTALRLNPNSIYAPRLAQILHQFDKHMAGIDDPPPPPEKKIKVVLETATFVCSHNPANLEIHLRLAEKILATIANPDPSWREKIEYLRRNCPRPGEENSQ